MKLLTEAVPTLVWPPAREVQVKIAALHARIDIGEAGERARVARSQAKIAAGVVRGGKGALPESRTRDRDARVAAPAREIEFKTAHRLFVRAGRRVDLQVEVKVLAGDCDDEVDSLSDLMKGRRRGSIRAPPP